MPITLTAEEFNEFAKYTRPERLGAFLMNHYKGQKFTIEPDIITSPSVTKQMISKLFAASFPRNTKSMNAFAAKCSADELLLELINQTQATGLCWMEPVAKDSARAPVISKVLSVMCSFRGYEEKATLSKFVNAEMVTADDIKLLLQYQFTQDLYDVRSIINLVSAKYQIAQLLEDWTIKDVQKFVDHCGEYDPLYPELIQIIESKESAALVASKSAGSTGPAADGYYSPDEDDVSSVGEVVHTDDASGP